MTDLPQHYTNEQTGISYTLVEDHYYLPDLALPDEPEYHIGRFGLMRKSYLKNHRKILYINLLTSGKLSEHLYEIDQTANDYLERISKQMAKQEGLTEDMKNTDPLLWVGKMTNIRNRVEEFIKEDLIYN
jgi:hypothetical protein